MSRLTHPFPARNLDDLLGGLFAPHTAAREARAPWTPRVELHEAEDAYTVYVELPGIDPASVEITAEGDVLTLKGEKPALERAEGVTLHRSERGAGAFTRTFKFPEVLREDAITATAKHGLLTLVVRKTPEVQPKRIVITSEER